MGNCRFKVLIFCLLVLNVRSAVANEILLDPIVINYRVQGNKYLGVTQTVRLDFSPHVGTVNFLMVSSARWLQIGGPPTINGVSNGACACDSWKLYVIPDVTQLRQVGQYTGFVTFSAPGFTSNRFTVNVQVEPLPLPPSPPPQQTSVPAVANTASGNSAVAPGSLISIYGKELMDVEGSASAIPLPTRVERVEWLLANRVLNLIYWSGTQVNALLSPTTPEGEYELAKRRYGQNGAYSETTFSPRVSIRPQAPGIFVMPKKDCYLFDPGSDRHEDGCEYGPLAVRGAVTDALGRLISYTNPAALNQPLTLWATGLGKAIANPQTGYVESVLKPEVWIKNRGPISLPGRGEISMLLGNKKATVLFAGPNPGFPGLDQINFSLSAAGMISNEFCGTRMHLEGDLLLLLPGNQESNSVKLPLLIKPTDILCK